MTLAKIKESDYLYSASRVKSIEKHMLTRERAEKNDRCKNNGRCH